MTIRLRGLALCALPLVLTACGSSGTPAAAPTAQAPSIASAKGNWVLTQLKGQAPVADTTITATFDAAGQVSGSAGCNTYGLTFAVDGNALKVASPPITTMMACSPDTVMTQERDFLAAMEATRNLVATDTALELTDAQGATLLSFKAGIRSLAATSWKVTGVLSGSAVTSLVEGTEATLEIAADGAVSGSATCNRFTGKATLGDDTVSFGPLASTMMACMEPAGAMEQEQAFLAALESVTGYEINGNDLRLTAGDTTAATLTLA